MKQELKKEFSARIIAANRSQLIVIMYEMMFAYMEDAKEHYEVNQWEEVKVDLDHVETVIRRLVSDLNHSYEISGQLYALYQFSLRQLALCKVKKNLEGMDNAKKVLDNLYVGMVGMAKQDDSGPLMRNSQKVVAGMTYGKHSMNEVCLEDNRRGFYA